MEALDHSNVFKNEVLCVGSFLAIKHVAKHATPSSRDRERGGSSVYNVVGLSLFEGPPLEELFAVDYVERAVVVDEGAVRQWVAEPTNGGKYRTVAKLPYDAWVNYRGADGTREMRFPA